VPLLPKRAIWHALAMVLGFNDLGEQGTLVIEEHCVRNNHQKPNLCKSSVFLSKLQNINQKNSTKVRAKVKTINFLCNK
jgi:hypothetical protein